MDPGTLIGTAIGIATGVGVPGTIAVLRFVPNLAAKSGERQTANGNGPYDAIRRLIDDRLMTVLQRQTEILESMRQTLQENTTALQVFMRLEEQRERLQSIKPATGG